MSDIKQVSAAFVKAQKAFGPALKSATNPHFRSKYADLAACVEAVIEALNDNGIALMQRNIACDSGVCVETVLIHESGEMLSSGPLHVPAQKIDAQGYGSALTYARRYSLMAACGIAPEDDDGNAAAKRKGTGNIIAPITPVGEAVKSSVGVISDERRAELDEAALVMIECFNAGKGLSARKTYDQITDNEERIYLHDLLKGESKLRAFLKAYDKAAA